MHMLIDMASSPQYLASSAQNPDHIDIDPRITTMADGSCAGIAPSTVAYSNSDHTSYSEVSHLSPFETTSVLDEHLLTPVSSAASPELQQRSCKQSPFMHHRELTPCHQQPTPPNTTVMYSYPDYTTSTSSMSMQTSAVADATAAPHELLTYLHGSPGQHDEQQQAPPPPPQPQPYFGSYSVSVPQEPVPEHYYLQGGTIDNPLGLLRADGGGGSYTHRSLAPLAQAPPNMPPATTTMIHPSHPPQQYSRREMGMALPKLSSPAHSRHASLSTRRDPARKARARRTNSNSNNNNNNNNNSSNSNNRRDSSFSPPTQGQYRFGGDELMVVEDDGPDEEVTLDDKTPADLRRLWDTRRKWLGKKGNGMWEDIMLEYHGEEALSENKKTQVKAALQMKIHRMLLKHGKWPARDEAALLRAYKRFEENRYNEILRMYEEEMSGRRKAYEWKSQHIEAQLVKMGLEEPERDRDSKARKRKQVAARHGARSAAAAAAAAGLHRIGGGPVQQHHHHHIPPPPTVRHPGLYDPATAYHHHYAQQHQHHHHHQQQQQQQQDQQEPAAEPAPPTYDARFEAASLAEQLGAHPPVLTDEQQERLLEEVLERDNGSNQNGEQEEEEQQQQAQQQADDARDQKRDYNAARPRAASLMDGVVHHQRHHGNQHQQHHHHQSPDLHAQRSEAVARGACAEMLMKQQQQQQSSPSPYGTGVAGA